MTSPPTSNASSQPPSQPPRGGRPFQFTLFGLMLLMTVVCMAAFIFRGLFSKQDPDKEVNSGFVVAACVVPMGVMIIAAVTHSLLAWNSERKRRKHPVENDEPF